MYTFVISCFSWTRAKTIMTASCSNYYISTGITKGFNALKMSSLTAIQRAIIYLSCYINFEFINLSHNVISLHFRNKLFIQTVTMYVPIGLYWCDTFYLVSQLYDLVSQVIFIYRVFKRNCRVLWDLIVGEQIIAASRVV